MTASYVCLFPCEPRLPKLSVLNDVALFDRDLFGQPLALGHKIINEFALAM